MKEWTPNDIGPRDWLEWRQVPNFSQPGKKLWVSSWVVEGVSNDELQFLLELSKIPYKSIFKVACSRRTNPDVQWECMFSHLLVDDLLYESVNELVGSHVVQYRNTETGVKFLQLLPHPYKIDDYHGTALNKRNKNIKVLSGIAGTKVKLLQDGGLPYKPPSPNMSRVLAKYERMDQGKRLKLIEKAAEESPDFRFKFKLNGKTYTSSHYQEEKDVF